MSIYTSSVRSPTAPSLSRLLRSKFEHPYVVKNGGYGPDTASDAIWNGEDLVAFGVPFLANPDLQRYRTNAPLNAPDKDTFYAGEKEVHGRSSAGVSTRCRRALL